MKISSFLQKGTGLLGAGIVVSAAGTFPVFPSGLLAFLLVYALLLWRYPCLWLFVLPALLPVFDLAPWSGRFFFAEFDLLILLTLSVRYFRWESRSDQSSVDAGSKWLLWSFLVVTAVSALLGVLPLAPLDANAFADYYSPYNSLRVFKGFLWAFLLLPLVARDLSHADNLRRLFIPGVLAGLGGTVVWSLWERQVFTGLLNFTNDFRIAAGFSTLHTGGATIDAYLAMTLPFIACCFVMYRSWLGRLAGILLLPLVLYVLVVTFSRIDYLAILASAVVMAAGFVLRSGRRKILVLTFLLLLGTVSFVSVSIQMVPYIQKRFETTSRDIDTRWQHWAEAVDMMDGNFQTWLFGMGLGSYPREFAALSHGRVKPATYQYMTEGNDTFVRLFGGDSLYLGQRVSLLPGRKYIIKYAVRSENERAKLTTPVCQKSLLHSFQCAWSSQPIGNTAGKWVGFEKTFQSRELGQGNPFYQRRPVEFALYNGLPDSFIDVDNIQLIDENGNEFLKNGNFERGNDHWFFTVDNHMPWHIKNLWVHLFFEQGWLGLILFNLILIAAVIHLVKKIMLGRIIPVVLLGSLAGFLTVGLVGSLFDSPRITLIFLLIIFVVFFGEEKDLGSGV